MNKISLLLSLCLLILPRVSQAGFLDGITCIRTGLCGLDDIATSFIFLTKLLLGAIGAIALLYFVWGAVQWITSGGNPDKVKKGKEIMTNTIFALIVSFTSYLLVAFMINNVLGAKPEYRIEAECKGKSQGAVCNGFQINYVCTGVNSFEGKWAQYNELCISKCALKNIEYKSTQDIFFPGEDHTGYVCMDKPKGANIIFETNLCPGDINHVCVLVDENNLPIISL